MPIHRGRDRNGSYYQYGNHGKRYYYKSNNQEARKNAKQKAIRQAIAIYSSGYREKKMR